MELKMATTQPTSWMDKMIDRESITIHWIHLSLKKFICYLKALGFPAAHRAILQPKFLCHARHVTRDWEYTPVARGHYQTLKCIHVCILNVKMI